MTAIWIYVMINDERKAECGLCSVKISERGATAPSDNTSEKWSET